MKVVEDKNPSVVTATPSNQSGIWPFFENFFDFYKKETESKFLRQLEITKFLGKDYGFKLSRDKMSIFIKVEFD